MGQGPACWAVEKSNADAAAAAVPFVVAVDSVI
jgi:hypothetical protein